MASPEPSAGDELPPRTAADRLLQASADGARAKPAHRGAVYTPRAIAEDLVERTLGAWLSQHPGHLPRVLDPSCGGGVFLVAAVRRLVAAGVDVQTSLSCVVGWDLHADAVASSQAALLAATGRSGARVERRDALDATLDASFDVVVGNPPWVDASTMCREMGDRRSVLAARFSVARGNWDLWCCFSELATRLLAPGGWHGFVVPRQAASAAYAAPTRRLLEKALRLCSIRVLDEDSFEVSAYPLVYVGCFPGGEDEPGARWPDAERLRGRPLGDLVQVHGAATVAEAYQLSPWLRDDRRPGPDDLRVCNSGTIDPGRALWGLRPMRYLGQKLVCPVVSAVAVDATPRRIAIARSPKLIVASMTRRLEVFHDRVGGWWPAKSTVVLRGDVDLRWVAAWLDAPSTQQLYRQRFGAQALRGGYQVVAPSHLKALPVPCFHPGEFAEMALLWGRLEEAVRSADEEAVAVVREAADGIVRRASER